MLLIMSTFKNAACSRGAGPVHSIFSIFVFPIFSHSLSHSKKCADIEEDMDDDSDIDDDAKMAQRAAEANQKNKDGKKRVVPLTLSQWHHCMQVYATALMIIPCRIVTPAMVMSHIATMMMVMDTLTTKIGVHYKNAFLDYDLLTRKAWKRTTELEIPGFSLAAIVGKIDTQTLTLAERNNPITSSPSSSSTTTTGAGAAAKATAKPQPRVEKRPMTCYTCYEVGHYSGNCPNKHWAPSQPPPPQTKVLDTAVGTSPAGDSGKGGKNTSKGGKQGKGKGKGNKSGPY